MSSRSSSPRRCSTCRSCSSQLNSNTTSALAAVHPELRRQPGELAVYILLYFALIIFFTYFYVSITFNPEERAEDMKKYGGFIPGIRPGRPTAEYLPSS